MAVIIDDVYQKVLAIANKEQRGYITPQEFNLFADQAQKEIFEQYFYDLNQFNRLPGNSLGHSDMRDILEHKISLFEVWADSSNAVLANDNGEIDIEANFPTTTNQGGFYRIIELRIDYGATGNFKVAEEMTTKEFTKYSNSPLTIYSKNRPVYLHYKSGFGKFKIFPTPEITNSLGVSVPNDIRISYIRKPTRPKWGYIVSGGTTSTSSVVPLYNAGDSNNFDLHESEENELVYRILKLSGIAIMRDDIMRAGQGMESLQVQQEKQ